VAYLHYQDLRDPTKWGIKHHNIFNYALEIQDNERFIAFHPDYILSLEGEKWLAPNAKVFLLYMRSGVHIVLKEKSYFDLPWKTRWRQGRGPEGAKMDPLEEYVRI
jgi:hypothetical protein